MMKCQTDVETMHAHANRCRRKVGSVLASLEREREREKAESPTWRTASSIYAVTAGEDLRMEETG